MGITERVFGSGESSDINTSTVSTHTTAEAAAAQDNCQRSVTAKPGRCTIDFLDCDTHTTAGISCQYKLSQLGHHEVKLNRNKHDHSNLIENNFGTHDHSMYKRY